AGGRADGVEQGPDRGRLACAVRPEKSERLTLVDLEVDVDDPAMRPIGLGELLDLDDRGHDILPAGARSRRNRSITRGSSVSMNPTTSRNSRIRASALGTPSAAITPCSAISRRRR